MEEGNLYACDKCKGQREAQKRTTVSSPPKVLTLSLKRFWVASYTPSFRVVKLDRPVEFPLSDLDLGQFATPGVVGASAEQRAAWKYHLLAIICHSGRACKAFGKQRDFGAACLSLCRSAGLLGAR